MEFKLDKELEDFLIARNIEQSIINYLINEKIDTKIMALMDDEQLKNIFPTYGDRIAVSDFCKKHQNVKTRKQSLLDRLRHKLATKKKRNILSSSDEEDSNDCKKVKSSPAVGTNEAKPQLRYVEIGWLHSTDGKDFKQVRAKNGGGTRKIRMRKDSKRTEMIEKGKKIFFPNGESAKGLRLHKFKTNLLDFSGKPISNNLTVEDLFQKAKLCKLRVYLSTEAKPKCETITSSNNDPDSFTPRSSEEDLHSLVSPEVTLEFTAEVTPKVTFPEHSTELILNNSGLDEFNISNSFLQINGSSQKIDTGSVNVLRHFEATQAETGNIIISEAENANKMTLSPIQNTYDCTHLDIMDDFINFPPITQEERDMILATHLQQEENEIIDKSPVSLMVHRGLIFDELIEIFSTQTIHGDVQIQIILPNGENEAGEDFGEVWRDALSEFWTSMMEKCTVGTNTLIPQIRHDFGCKKWKTIAKILRKGWTSEGYFPIKLSRIFMENSILKRTYGNIHDEFLQLISEEERELLKEALQNFDAVDLEELIDVLGRFDCKSLPNEKNLKRIIDEIADKEIIQKPAFISDCFYDELQGLMTQEQLDCIYKNCKPTSKNILSLLKFEEVINQNRDKVSGFLKKFIRESDEKLRMSFLRFCTGSDIPLGQKIKINFVSDSGKLRSPTAHTCSNTLVLPESYENFLDFRSEFSSLLNSNIWVMDII